MNQDVLNQLKRESTEWLNMALLFLDDPGPAAQQLASKEQRCQLCPNYKKIQLNEDGNEYYACPECPVVIASGRTCFQWWQEYGICPGSDTGFRVANITHLLLNKVIEDYEKGVD